MINPIIDNLFSFLFGAGGSGLVYYILDRRKRSVEVKLIEADLLDKMRAMYENYVETHNKEYLRLQEKYEEILRENTKLSRRVEELSIEVKQLKGTQNRFPAN